ncbi:hypothetical protein DOTSEDRAFT_69348 [Dothistroma septosporum NZE10]|uniref:Uncharacterized protein n=1 Tax=Dothistroma septosporum (strain NZE10 / CBS 128990) TaxID=675120 RepID=N1PV78_DOTSN|nr:hypothetical protein DOTSEDRAFT_69348 [Dothistroma septosporum NZE10]
MTGLLYAKGALDGGGCNASGSGSGNNGVVSRASIACVYPGRQTRKMDRATNVTSAFKTQANGCCFGSRDNGRAVAATSRWEGRWWC